MVEGVADGCVLIGRILERDYCHGQAVDKDYNVRTAVPAVLGDCKLVGGNPIIVVRIIDIQELDFAMHLAIVLHI